MPFQLNPLDFQHQPYSAAVTTDQPASSARLLNHQYTAMSNSLPSTPSVSDLSSVGDMETPVEMRRTIVIPDDDPFAGRNLENAAPKPPSLSSAMEAAIAAAAAVNNPSVPSLSPSTETNPVTPVAYAFPDANTATPSSYPFPDPDPDPDTPTANAQRRASNNPRGRPQRYRVGARGGRPRKRVYGDAVPVTRVDPRVNGAPAGWDHLLDKSIPLATRLSVAAKKMKPGLMFENQYGDLWHKRKMETTASENKQRKIFEMLKQEFQEFCDEKKRAREAEAKTSEPSIAQERAEMFGEDETRYDPSDRHTQKDSWVNARLAESSLYYVAPVKMEAVSEEEFSPEEIEGEEIEEGEESNQDDNDSSQSEHEGEDDDAETIESEEAQVDVPEVISISSSSDSGYEEDSDEDMEE